MIDKKVMASSSKTQKAIDARKRAEKTELTAVQ